MKFEPYVHLNGALVPSSEARISVFDRGFLFGDAVYEVIPVYQRRIVYWHAHLERLNRSLQSIRMRNPYDAEQWETFIGELVAHHPESNQSVYIQVTRGTEGNRHHLPDMDICPTVVMFSAPLPPFSAENAAKGLSAITTEDIRWQYCHIKSTNLLANVLLLIHAHDEQAEEVILLRNGKITEGATSNVFIARNGKLMTPPLNDSILAGVTRQAVFRSAAKAHIPCIEQELSQKDLIDADEIMLSSTTRGIRPVLYLDGRSVGDHKPGPIWQRLMQPFENELTQALETGTYE